MVVARVVVVTRGRGFARSRAGVSWLCGFCCNLVTGTATDNISFRRALADACRKAGLPVPAVPGSD